MKCWAAGQSIEHLRPLAAPGNWSQLLCIEVAFQLEQCVLERRVLRMVWGKTPDECRRGHDCAITWDEGWSSPPMGYCHLTALRKVWGV